MGATRFFVSGVLAPGHEAPLDAADARKLSTVLRKRDGAALEVIDSAGRVFAARLRSTTDGAVAVLERELAAPPPLRLEITLAQGVPKGSKMDFVVEKATELGVARVLAFTSSRSAGESVRAGKLERWRRVAESAAKQCGRLDVPAIDGPLDFAALVRHVAAYDVALLPWELAPLVPLREVLPGLVAGVRRVLVAIGPEGGIAASEAETLVAAGARAISLGSRILRTETAGLVAVSALLFAGGDL